MPLFNGSQGDIEKSFVHNARIYYVFVNLFYVGMLCFYLFVILSSYSHATIAYQEPLSCTPLRLPG